MITTLLATCLLGSMGNDFEYKIGDQTFVGYRAIVPGSKLTVFVVQDWNGLNEHEKGVVDRLAGEGYSAVAIDVYGKGVRPTNAQESGAEARKYYSDPDLFMKRLTGCIEAVAPKGKSVAVGYCFGGTGVLELGRRNLGGLTGVVSFHGGLKPLAPANPKINANVVVLNGDSDPVCPIADQEAVKEEMKRAKSFVFVNYAGAKHAFAVKGGANFQEAAEKGSWIEFMNALKLWSK